MSFFMIKRHFSSNKRDGYVGLKWAQGLVDHSHIKSTGHMMVRWDLLWTSKGIAEVVDFFQNYGLLPNAKLFSLQDELCTVPCAYIGSERWFEVVSGQCDRSLAITTERNILACVSFLILYFQENCYAEKSNQKSRQEGCEENREEIRQEEGSKESRQKGHQKGYEESLQVL